MAKFKFMVEITAHTTKQAEALRNEVVGVIEDNRESHTIKADAHVSPVERVEEGHDPRVGPVQEIN